MKLKSSTNKIINSKPKKKKNDKCAIPSERCIPVFTVECAAGTITWNEKLTRIYILNEYCSTKKMREYYDALLPLDYLEHIKELYQCHLEIKKAGKVNVNKYTDEKYSDYIKSSEWKVLRQRIIQERKACECCGSSDLLHVHHLTYENFTHELDTDLKLLCHDCHCKEHGRYF